MLGHWFFTVPFLPPSVNHQYVPIGKQGQKALTPEARGLRDSLALAAGATGFCVQPKACYAVRLVFTMPGWSGDIDGPLKSCLDSVFGTRWDHRVIRLEVDKVVEKGIRATYMEIKELPDPTERALKARMNAKP